LQYYIDNAPGKKKDSPLTPYGNLTTAEKKRILLNNIFGVDIDAQAVEVTKLNLLLKALEGETQASINQQLQLFHERVLPNLNQNVKCGNSLIGPDFFDNQLNLFPEQIKKINAFDWIKSFPEIFKQGGFDAVIGNPPYVLGRETFENGVKDYLAKKYVSYGGKFDLYIYFTERAISLLNKNGRFSFIIPNTILVNENATKLRKLLLEYSLETIRLFDYRVFQQAQVETVIIIASNSHPTKNHCITIESREKYELLQKQFQNDVAFRFNIAFDEQTSSIINKVKTKSERLGDISDICIVIQLGGSGTKKESYIGDKELDDTWKKVLDGKDINRFYLKWSNTYVRYGDWLHRKRNEKYFLNPKILIRQIGQTPVATYDGQNFYTLNTLYNLIGSSDVSLKFILGVISSRLGKWFWLKHNSDFKSLFPKIKKTQIEAIPIVKIFPENKNAVKQYESVISLVDKIIQLRQQLETTKLDTQIQQIQRTIDHTERKIDKLVYELYGLSEEEITIVEGK